MKFLKNLMRFLPIGMLVGYGFVYGSFYSLVLASVVVMVMSELHSIKRKVENCKPWYY